MKYDSKIEEPLLLKDNSQIPPDKISEKNKPIFDLLNSKNLGKLKEENKNIIIHPDDASYELDKLYILRKEEETYKTTNLMGVIYYRNNKEQFEALIRIGSRFDEDENGKINPNQPFLTYMLSMAFEGIFLDWKPPVGESKIWDLLLIFLFSFYIKKAIIKGLYKEYINFKYNNYNFKGVLDCHRHIITNIPFLGKVSYNLRERTPDNPTMHLIRHADCYIKEKRISFYNSLLTQIDVSEFLKQVIENTPSFNSRNIQKTLKQTNKPVNHPYFVEYENLRKISRMLLMDEGTSLYDPKKEEEIYGVLFDGAWLWECFVGKLISELKFNHNRKSNRHIFVKNGKGSFRPDFFSKDNNCVLDAKYKDWDYPNSDIYQVISYMYLLKLEKGGIIFPTADPNKGIEERILNGLGGKWFTIPFNLPPMITNDLNSFPHEMKKITSEWTMKLKNAFNKL